MSRHLSLVGRVWLGILLSGAGVVHGQQSGSIVGWGDHVVVDQSAIESLVAVAAGGLHSLGLKSDGSIRKCARSRSSGAFPACGSKRIRS